AAIARNVFGFFVDIGIMGFALFFAFRDGAASVERLQQSIPMAEPDRHQLFHSLKHTILAVVQGLSLTALVQGILVGVGLWTLGVPFALLLGACAFVLAFLPVGGAALIWIPTAVCLALTGSYIRAGMLLMWGGLVVSSIDNIVRPYLISGQTRLSTPLLFFGIIGGLKAFGFIGLFLGPTLLAAFAQLMRIFREQYLAAPASSP
ncbi:MAG: AI-2E family transporter, partial [Candidatus Binatia bacterium]